MAQRAIRALVMAAATATAPGWVQAAELVRTLQVEVRVLAAGQPGLPRPASGLAVIVPPASVERVQEGRTLFTVWTY